MMVYSEFAGVAAKIEYLRTCGSSLIMNWGEDTNAWEVDWITSGERFRGVAKSLSNALDIAQREAVNHFNLSASDA